MLGVCFHCSILLIASSKFTTFRSCNIYMSLGLSNETSQVQLGFYRFNAIKMLYM